MDFFRKKKGDGKSKKKGQKDKNDKKNNDNLAKMDVSVKNVTKGSNFELNTSQNLVHNGQETEHFESPSFEVDWSLMKPEPENEVPAKKNCNASPNGVQAYKQFNDVLDKMDRALLTEESEDDMDSSSLGLTLRKDEKIDMTHRRLNNGTFDSRPVTTPSVAVEENVGGVVTAPPSIPMIHVTQPSTDSTREVDAVLLKSPMEWNPQDVVNWCNSKSLGIFAELFEGCDIDGMTLLEMTEEDLIELEIDDVGERERFLREIQELQKSLPEGVKPGGESNKVEEMDLPMASWTNEDILIWLERVGLTKFLTVFRDYEVTGEQLMELDLQMMDDLGITQVEDREEFLSKFYELLNDSPPTAEEEPVQQSEELLVESSQLTYNLQDMEESPNNDNLQMVTRPAQQIPSPEPEQKIEKIWTLIETGQSQTEGLSPSEFSDELSPRNEGRGCITPLTEIELEIQEMEDTISKLQRDLQGSEDSQSEEHESLQLKLSSAQNRLRSLHQQKSVMEDLSEDSKSQDASFEIQTSELYNLMSAKPLEMVTVEIQGTEDGGPGFTAALDEEHGGIVVTSCQSDMLITGDRLLEVNGYNISGVPQSVFNQFLATNPPPLRLVVIRQKQETNEEQEEIKDLKDDLTLVLRDLEVAVAENKELKKENSQLKISIRELEDDKSQHAMQIKMLQEQVEVSEKRWKDLRKTLVKMKNDQFDLESAFGSFSQWQPQSGTKSNLDEAIQTVAVLQKTLEDKHIVLSKTKKEKNEYKKRLNQILNESTSSDLNYELLDDKKPIWESLESRSKKEVLQALKDTVLENERKKVCLDQLLSVVMRLAPGLLQKVDILNEINFEDVKNRPEFQC